MSARNSQSWRLRLFCLALLAVTFLSLMPLATAGSLSGYVDLPDGAACAKMPSTESGEKADEASKQCQSAQCLPGPNNPGVRTTWYCTASDMDCAWPDEPGYEHGTSKSLGGRSYECVSPVFWGRAQFLPK